MPHRSRSEPTLRDVFSPDSNHLGETDGDWGLPFVLRLMFARWP